MTGTERDTHPGAGSGPAAGPPLLLTDSGLGGLAVCAGIERSWRRSGRPGRLTFFNAAPDPLQGYNSLPEVGARAALLDRALSAMERWHPQRIVLACNTLSVLYSRTAHAHGNADRVTGIVQVGLRLFADALAADPGGLLLLLGTRTTIESGVHREALLRQGFAPLRIDALACHGLARAIEEDPDGPTAGALIEQCAAQCVEHCAGQLSSQGPRGREPGFRPERLYAGLACTHYGYAAERIRRGLETAVGLPVRLLDPNRALAEAAAALGGPARAEGGAQPGITVRVLSKVPLPERSRRVIAARLQSVSEATAAALLAYTHDPGLF